MVLKRLTWSPKRANFLEGSIFRAEKGTLGLKKRLTWDSIFSESKNEPCQVFGLKKANFLWFKRARFLGLQSANWGSKKTNLNYFQRKNLSLGLKKGLLGEQKKALFFQCKNGSLGSPFKKRAQWVFIFGV